MPERHHDGPPDPAMRCAFVAAGAACVTIGLVVLLAVSAGTSLEETGVALLICLVGTGLSGAACYQAGDTEFMRRAMGAGLVLFSGSVAFWFVPRASAALASLLHADGFPPIVLAVAVLLVPTALIAWLLPARGDVSPLSTPPPDARRLAGGTTHSVRRWRAKVPTGIGFLLVVVPWWCGALTGSVVSALRQEWAPAAICASHVVLLIAFFNIRTQIDDRGIIVRSVLWWPYYRVPLHQIVRADVEHYSASRAFFGLDDNKNGVFWFLAMRNGPAIRITTTGRDRTVGALDPAEGAALLNTLADDARHRREQDPPLTDQIFG